MAADWLFEKLSEKEWEDEPPKEVTIVESVDVPKKILNVYVVGLGGDGFCI